MASHIQSVDMSRYFQSLNNSRSGEKHSTTSRVSPYTSFVHQPLPACFITEQSTVKASLFVKQSAEGHFVAHALRKFVRRVGRHFYIFSALLRVSTERSTLFCDIFWRGMKEYGKFTTISNSVDTWIFQVMVHNCLWPFCSPSLLYLVCKHVS